MNIKTLKEQKTFKARLYFYEPPSLRTSLLLRNKKVVAKLYLIFRKCYIIHFVLCFFTKKYILLRENV